MDPKTLGYILRAVRHEKGKSLRKVTEDISIDYSFLSKIETGAATIQRHQFVTLCHYYKIDRHHIGDKCSTFFPELKIVLHANLEHNEDRIERTSRFLKKYQGLKYTRYRPYLDFVELEKLSYEVCKNDRFHYLIETLTPDLFIQPYKFFFTLRKMYHYGQVGQLDKAREYIPIVEEMMGEVESKFHPFGYFYLMATHSFLGDNVNIVSLYTKALFGFKKMNNAHFMMLTDIMYGVSLMTQHEYRYAIRFYEELLANPTYTISDISKEAIVYNIGESYFNLNDLEQALRYFNESYRLIPQRSTAFYIVYCLYSMGDIIAAERMIGEALKIANQSRLYTALLEWFYKFLYKQKTKSQEIIHRLEDIEEKYDAQIDYTLSMVFLRIKADFYHRFKDYLKSNEYLREMIKKLVEK